MSSGRGDLVASVAPGGARAAGRGVGRGREGCARGLERWEEILENSHPSRPHRAGDRVCSRGVAGGCRTAKARGGSVAGAVVPGLPADRSAFSCQMSGSALRILARALPMSVRACQISERARPSSARACQSSGRALPMLARACQTLARACQILARADRMLVRVRPMPAWVRSTSARAPPRSARRGPIPARTDRPADACGRRAPCEAGAARNRRATERIAVPPFDTQCGCPAECNAHPGRGFQEAVQR